MPVSRDTVVLGTLCGLASAVGYTAANVALRMVVDLDPVWVSCVKSFPTLALFAPWLVVLYRRREPILPARSVLGALLLAALFGQLFGNVAFQWSLGIVGIALAVPLTLGSMIVSGAVMGRSFLGETLSWRALFSIVLLVIAIFVLSQGAGEANRAVAGSDDAVEVSTSDVLLGVLAACVSGVAYAILGVVIRYGVSGRVSLTTTLLTVSSVGLVSLGGLATLRIGIEGMLATPVEAVSIMLVAGVCNALAFLALVKALQLTTLVYVNALNATQCAMAALAGVLLFFEPWQASLGVGLLLTVAGLMVMDRGSAAQKRHEKEEAVE